MPTLSASGLVKLCFAPGRLTNSYFAPAAAISFLKPSICSAVIMVPSAPLRTSTCPLTTPARAGADPAAEAVPDRGDTVGIHVRILLQEVEGSQEASLDEGGIFRCLRREGLGFRRMRGDLPLAVHVDREAHVAVLRRADRLIPRVLVVAPPLVDHQDAGTLPLGLRVPGEEALKLRVALR